MLSRKACAIDKPAKEAPRTTMLRGWFRVPETLVVPEAVRAWPVLGGGLTAGKVLLSRLGTVAVVFNSFSYSE